MHMDMYTVAAFICQHHYLQGHKFCTGIYYVMRKKEIMLLSSGTVVNFVDMYTANRSLLCTKRNKTLYLFYHCEGQ